MHKTKYRKYHKGLSYYKYNNVATSGTQLANVGPTPIYGIVTREVATLTEKQIETARRTLARALKSSKGKGLRYWIRVYPDTPVTAKPAEVRMGKGKGSVSYWATRAKIGKVLFEFEENNVLQAKFICNSLSNKLGIPSLSLLT